MNPNITFIGAGIATSYCILELLNQVKDKDIDLTITVIDKSNDFFKGFPYGERSGKAVLLIQNLENFISEPDKSDFIKWMEENIENLLLDFRNSGKEYALNWINNNKTFIEKKQWNQLYVPRFFFGNYISEKVENAIKTINNVKVLTITGEVTSIKKSSATEFAIKLDNGTTLYSEKTVLATGSLPYKILKGSENIDSRFLYVKQPYDPSSLENIKRVKEFINHNKTKIPFFKILVLGANASGLEMIYRLNEEIDSELNVSYTSMSSHGIMPDSKFNLEKYEKFYPKHLHALKEKKKITAEDIGIAANKDIDLAESLQIGAATSVKAISPAFAQLLPKLNENELLKFAYFHGNQIGSRQRCAGKHYTAVIEGLTKNKRFKHLKGRFIGIENNSNGIKVNFSNGTESNSEIFDVVINCLGSMKLDDNNLPNLYKSLQKDNLATIAPSKIGIIVDKQMQASENLFIAGPLLAGNKIKDKIFWHLEHCVRIIYSSRFLAHQIIDKL
ncbi:hypothetical protein BUL40_08375 [Croceivirga radicis]|uniref:FAD-dependent urate hydroxylase HpyO/Asp monooxygenase CreE-like FAD/NAD(P)-binding domain-containing protein n=1 Tax=Croceivirga radicis TaxID=1929488 RepID=A0A1V6LSE5_9FLAO|nr:FAD/NAD(P)-binding protein [Croceivirga radicis]OQD43095.1 hypothetical protein BUL40_08375 [Croceivirga radicis]